MIEQFFVDLIQNIQWCINNLPARGYDIIGAFVWSAFYLLLGYVFANSFALVQNVVVMIFIFSGLMIVISLGSLYIAKIMKKKIH